MGITRTADRHRGIPGVDVIGSRRLVVSDGAGMTRDVRRAAEARHAPQHFQVCGVQPSAGARQQVGGHRFGQQGVAEGVDTGRRDLEDVMFDGVRDSTVELLFCERRDAGEQIVAHGATADGG